MIENIHFNRFILFFFFFLLKYQVYVTADVIANMCAPTNHRAPLSVIDAGDGKGYLSTRLALEHKLKVLGVDCNPINVNGALLRLERLEVITKQRRKNTISLGTKI